MTEIIETTELILDLMVAGTPVRVRGVLKDKKLEELSGLVKISKSFNEFLDQLGPGFAGANEALRLLTGGPDITLDSLGFGYQNREPKFATVAVTLTSGNTRCRFVSLKSTGTAGGFVAGLELQLDKGLFKNNPLSGVVGELSLGDMGIYYASDKFDNVAYDPRLEFQDANLLAPPAAPQMSARGFNQGVNWSAQIFVGGVNLLDKLGIKNKPNAPVAPTAPALSQGNPTKPQLTDQTTWIEINKSLGPLSVQRIGLAYQAPRVAVKIDASLQFSVITLSLLGLGVSYPLDKFADLKEPAKFFRNLGFQLDGAAVSMQQGSLAISGGLLKVSDSPLQLDGALVVRIGELSIVALASYANLAGTPSFFVFAALIQDLGGPAFFFVTGLAFGVGINRQLKLPEINEVQNFPLIQAVMDPNYLGPKMDLRAVSAKLNQYLAPMPGNFWIAAGVKFTSFRQIDSFALLSVSFGTQFQIALLGLSRIWIPKPPLPAIIYAELALKVVFAPEMGVLSVEARLTENSYILRKDFTLRGGFAFYSWFAGDHAGDFVISLGGYHPRFLPPAHYPRPDLVQFYSRIGDVTIQGSCYFALCPVAIMAGGSLSLVYQSGGIRAWFIACANFLVQWKPLHYDIEIAISVGVALSLDIGIARINISVELGASVNLYGPPLGGEARISLYVVSFTVRFGESKQLPPPLLWESGDPAKSFAKSFLTNPDVTQIVLADGLLEEVQHQDKTATRFVNPQKLTINCRTQAPATAALFNRGDLSGGKPPTWNTAIGVRPMAKAQCYSLLEITLAPSAAGIQAERKKKMEDYLSQYLDFSPITGRVPAALWDVKALDLRIPPPNQPNQMMVTNALIGLELKTKPGPRPWQTPVLELQVLKYDRKDKTCDFAFVSVTGQLPAPGKETTIRSTINRNDVADRRKAIVNVLRQTKRRVIDPEKIRLPILAANAPYIFQAMPVMARLGQYPPRGYLAV